MKQIKQMAAIAGLAALVSGCDEPNSKVVATCTNGDLKVDVVYHEIGGDADVMTLELYRTSVGVGDTYLGAFPAPKLRGDTMTFQLRCDEGKELRFGYNFFTVNKPYFVEASKK